MRGMTTVWLLLAAAGVMIFGLTLGVMRGMGDENREVEAALFPTNCAPPCFLNIRPGETRLSEARTILDAHPWVRDYYLTFRVLTDPSEERNATLVWHWNGQQPRLLRTPFVEAGEMEFVAGTAQAIRVATAIPFGEVWLRMGMPSRGYLRLSRTYLGRFDNHLAIYEAAGVSFRTLLEHPPRIESYWYAPVEVRYAVDLREGEAYRMPCWLNCDG
ncbi:MAG: hypothetical protein J0L63_18960 [Anaerolineae bacterium]|nr:hypothetical protein [Anaerolineae bacterium]